MKKKKKKSIAGIIFSVILVLALITVCGTVLLLRAVSTAVNSHQTSTAATTEITESAAVTPAPTAAPTPTATPKPASSSSNGIRSEFKAAMDEYEEFFDSYVEFMQKYQENPTDTALMMQYLTFMTQYTETMNALENLDTSELNDAELKYYTETMLRIENKLLNAVS